MNPGARFETLEERFFRNFSKGKDNECWEWTGTLTWNGYGYLRKVINGLNIQLRAHRFSYEHFIGEIPYGLVLDHLCENTKCVNPKHLEPTTIYDNAQRSYVRKGKSINLVFGGQCQKGIHTLESLDDIYLGINKKHGWKSNRCKKCYLEQQRIYNHTRRG